MSAVRRRRVEKEEMHPSAKIEAEASSNRRILRRLETFGWILAAIATVYYTNLAQVAWNKRDR